MTAMTLKFGTIILELRSGSATAPPIEMLREGLRLGQNRGLDSLVCEADRRRLHRFRCSVKDYAWGKIGGWIHSCKESSDGQIDSTRPYAELWMGTHESGPSYLEDDADGVTLRSWIAENPEALGEMGL
ncbi:hypothetical protein F2Q69_00033457 [Brassica cretica]|uniref:Phosphomannose isomerase type I catalytic domain-containing protein n=1 Tax=Brassica cretica TaxID=69181 RepID=A0A8S9SNY5_BRACR|nr:hypothetical protein F2Q69_00033457 [Brassica cretica]